MDEEEAPLLGDGSCIY